MLQKTVGIIGGLGPLATVAFMNSVLKHTPVKNGRDHLHMIVDCNPKVPDINAAALGVGPSAAEALVRGCKRLEAAGADFIVMVCNAAHIYEDQLRHAVSLPFVSMIDETIRAIQSHSARYKYIGLLASDGCIRSELYQERFVNAGLGPILQTDEEQQRLTRTLAQIASGNIGPEIRLDILGLIDALVKRGAETVVLACSEIALVDLNGVRTSVVDPCVELAKSTIRFALSEE
ncbi:aspartate/glutamate racemase family protein [Sinorhizobium meliloti]|uniref:aspartate/glutamate racemase family protein n=1 Tax=Rhizobium meliloti TaxID=382 RepID=UPI00209196C9|nr:amino acid racemase [Sinorhizobium meliloti]MCO5965417.1 amino acid racemase [Sinorhizobium meliloti]